MLNRRLPLLIAMLVMGVLGSTNLGAHELSFNSEVTYSSSQPSGGGANIANWTGAAFDADNVGGSGVNADGGSGNGAANDASTYVAGNQPRQGQTFTTGSNPDGYQLTAVTARMAGYTDNNATGSNRTSWDLNAHNGPIQVEIGKVSGTDVQTLTKQMFIMGRTGNPGAGTSANGAGDHITFHLPFTTYLEPNTTYSFDFWIGNGSNNYFEWLGTRTDQYSGGTAYNRAWWGGPITPLTGERVFQLELTALSSPAPAFVHPGTLHTQTDLNRMAAKVAANEEPWLSGWNMLLSSPYNNLGWPAYDVDYIVRGGTGNNYTRSQQDAQLIYTLTLIWHITGDTAYANRAVEIANVWSDLIGLQGDTNRSLAAGICGYLFAISGELLSTYPGWPEAEQQAYKDMMMRVFYPENLDFLWRHHDTPWSQGGNTHYRLNWDTANMASMAAIGVLCDNRAVYEQAVDYFKAGPGNGRIERAAWYIHPDGQAQTEEIGRDQGHNLIGLYQMALLCQTAWNQGDDLFAYDDNRILRALEHTTKFNLFYTVPWAYHRNASLTYTETLATGDQGKLHFFHELAYNHYVNIKGMAAPYNEDAAAIVRPERWPDTANHPSEVDWLGHGTLTFTLDPVSGNPAPSGLEANWSAGQVTLNWQGAPYATGYNVKRSTTPGGPYSTIGTAGDLDTTYIDTNVSNGSTYYYVVSATTPSGQTANSAERMVGQRLVTHYTFEGNANDVVGGQNGVLQGGSTGAPAFVAGHNGGQAIDLDGVDDYVELPKGIANYQDITVAAWVYWDGGGAWQRIFDFGTEKEKSMFLTPSNGSGSEFAISTSRFNEGTGRLNSSILPMGTWAHVAVTLDGDNGYLYVDGAQAATAVINEVDPLFGQPFCYLGRSMWNADPLFNGHIDDFRIYNYALSGSEIANLASMGGGDTTPPAAPTGLVATVGDGSVVLNWNDNTEPDLASYKVYRSTTSGSGYASIATGVAASAYTDNTVTNGTTYYYVVTAVDTSSNESGNSNQASATPQAEPDTTPPAAPTGLVATAGDGSVVLNWNDNTEPDLASYKVYRSTTSGSGYASIATGVAASAYTDNTVTNGTTYYYVVTAVDTSSNESGNSTEASATPQGSSGPTTMHVDSIVLSTVNVGQGNKKGQAQVTILDNTGAAVSGATVTGSFTGSYNETVSANTGSNGVAILITTSTKKGGVTFTFCVDNVVGTLTYDSNQNVVTCSSF